MSTASCRRSRSPSSFTPKASATSIWSRRTRTPIRLSDIAPGTKTAHRDELDAVMKTLRAGQGRFGASCSCRPAPPKSAAAASAARWKIRRAASDQSGGLRRLRRLLGAVELHLGRAAGDRTRAQAHHQSIDLQQGLFLPEGLLPVLRHRRWRQAAPRAPADLGDIGDLPEPASRPSLDRPYNVAVGGVGGTGVLTIGALLGMAAHIEGKASMILDMSGLAQKGGAVLSHVRLSEHTADVTCSRIVTGTADLVLAADEVVAASKDTITLCESAVPTASSTATSFRPRISSSTAISISRAARFNCAGNGVAQGFLASSISPSPPKSLLGNSIATNMMMMGYAYQKGLLPLSAEGDRAGDRGQRRRDQDEHRRRSSSGVWPRPIRRGWPR